jgi:hypothetical protein
MPRPLTIALIVALAAAPSTARPNGDGSGAAPPTVFERFVLSGCSPCVRETFPIATLPVAPIPLPGFPRAAAASGVRPGEILIEVLRAHQPGRADWKSLALRVTLSVATGTGGDLFRLGTGLLDGADVRTLAQAVGEMARIVTTPQGDPRADTVDMDFHGGTLRVGVLQIRGDAVGYVQTGDLPILLQRAVWEVPTTLYVPVKDLPELATALGQAAARIEQARGN